MNPEQSSIYRGLELLMQWYLPIGVKMPKVEALQNMGNFFQKNLMEAMAACAVALNSYDMAARMEFIDTMIWHLSLCNTSVSQLYVFSSQRGQTVRVISETQYANYLEHWSKLKNQIGRWQVKKMEHVCERIMKEGVCENRLRLLNEIVSSVNSYSGFLVHGATYKIQKDMMYGTHYFWKVGYMWKNLSVVRVRKKYRLRNWLEEEERHRWRVMRAWEPRRRSGFPEGKRLPMIW